MYAIVEMGGMQWKVTKAMTLRVPRIDEEPGKPVEFDRILLIVNKDKVDIGTPWIKNARVKATVVSHGKAKKIKVFKKKRRKDYKVLKGHRQDFTELRIDGITLGGETKITAAKTKPEPKAAAAPVKKEPAKTIAKTKPVPKKTVTPKKKETEKTDPKTTSSAKTSVKKETKKTKVKSEAKAKPKSAASGKKKEE